MGYSAMSEDVLSLSRRAVHRLCPHCGGHLVTEELLCVDHVVSGEEFPVCSCDSCGFYFTGLLPSAEEMPRYYHSAGYVSHSNTSSGLVNKAYHLVRRYMLSEKCSLVSHYTGKHSGRLLDYGAGIGYFADRMSRAGWSVEAVEPDEGACAFAFSRFGLRMRKPSDLPAFADGSFDCITLWHALEHVPDAAAAMLEFLRLLSRDGLLFLALPNRTSYDACHYGRDWAAWDVPRHVWHFSPADIQCLSGETGFSLVEMLPMHFDAFYASILSERGRGSRFALARGFAVGVASFLSTLANTERGSSLIYVLKKK